MANTLSNSSKSTPRFSAAHVVVLGSALVLLGTAAVLTPSIQEKFAEARDAERLNDVQAIRVAIEEYVRDHGTYPAHDDESGRAGWDTTLDRDFLSVLEDEGYIDRVPLDPVNDDTYHYRYFLYAEGYEGFESRFYVLGVRRFETPEYRQTHSGWKGEFRDWSEEFDFVIGGAEN